MHPPLSLWALLHTCGLCRIPCALPCTLAPVFVCLCCTLLCLCRLQKKVSSGQGPLPMHCTFVKFHSAAVECAALLQALLQQHCRAKQCSALVQSTDVHCKILQYPVVTYNTLQDNVLHGKTIFCNAIIGLQCGAMSSNLTRCRCKCQL